MGLTSRRLTGLSPTQTSRTFCMSPLLWGFPKNGQHELRTPFVASGIARTDEPLVPVENGGVGAVALDQLGSIRFDLVSASTTAGSAAQARR
jgi:hypothetical protein